MKPAASSISALSWLAGAIAGRPLRTVPLAAGSASYTDGVAIHVDAGLVLAQQRLVVIAHSLLLGAGSLPADIVDRLQWRGALARRYFGLELVRAAALHTDRLPPSFLASLNLTSPSSGSPDESFAKALAGETVSLPNWLGELRPRQLATAVTLAHAARAKRGAADPESDDDQPLTAGDRELLERFRVPTSGWGLADLLLKLMDYRRSAGDAASAEHSEDEGGAALANATARQVTGRGKLLAEAPRARANHVGAPDHGALLYPEWDVQRQCYRPNHVRVAEIIPHAEDDAGDTEPPRVPLPGLGAALARIGVRYEHVRGRNKGEELDLDALIDLTVQRRSGHSSHENIYITTEASRRDLTVLLLLDISRSTADQGADGLNVLQRHSAIAGQLAEVFERLGDRIACFGFHSWGRERVRLVHIKAFDERASVAPERIAALTPSGLTRMGAAIRHASALLGVDRYHTHRLMVMLTDGFAYDDGYEGAYARGDTARALAEAAVQGIACVCVNIGTDQDDATLRQLYGDAAYLRSADTAGLVPALKNLMTQALYRASLARMRRHGAG